MIVTINLSNEKTLTLKNSLGYKVRYQRASGKPCDTALMEIEKTQDTMVLLAIAYCMATPTPEVDFEHWADEIDGADFMKITEEVVKLYSAGLPTEKQIKKAKN